MVIFSGIQPTGRKHLGNYIGAITQYVAGQDRADPAIYCIVDLHAVTVPYDPADLRERTLRHGGDPDRLRARPRALHPLPPGRRGRAHGAAWLLSSVTPVGELNRMHQFRDKSAAQRELVSAGLLYYPVLMAADVLAYRAHEVPVGEDQREHLELMRDVAERFNRRFGDLLVVPEARIPSVGARVADLQDPTRKMSTTGSSEQGTVYVLDDPETIRRKFKRAVADSGREIVRARRQAGHLEPDRDHAPWRASMTPEAVEAEFEGSGYGDFKAAVAEAVIEWLAPVRERYDALRSDEAELERILEGGAGKAREIAVGTLADVRDAMGVGPKRSVGSAP